MHVTAGAVCQKFLLCQWSQHYAQCFFKLITIQIMPASIIDSRSNLVSILHLVSQEDYNQACSITDIMNCINWSTLHNCGQ